MTPRHERERGPGHRHHGNPEDLDAFVARMEDPARAEWQRPDEVIRALGLGARDVVGEVGPGPGFFTLRLARVVRHVYSVEAEPRILSVLRDRLAAAGVRNVTPVLGMDGAPLLAEESIDLALAVNTFHHFPDGAAYLHALASALRPGGRIANIDFHKRELPVGPSLEHMVAREDFLSTAEKAGLELVDEKSFLPYQYFLVLHPKAPRGP